MEKSDPIRVLMLAAGGQRFALPLAAVREVIDAARLAPVPLTPPALAGVIDLRGRIVPVLDIAILVGLTAAPLNAQIVLAAVDGHDAEVGFRVDDVAGLAVSQRSRPPQPDTPPFVSAVLDTSDGGVPLLDLAALVESFHAAGRAAT